MSKMSSDPVRHALNGPTMGTRWQAVLRDLDRLGVGLSGLRVVEPHKDG